MRASTLSTLVQYWGGYSTTECTPYCTVLDYTCPPLHLYVRGCLIVHVHFKFDRWDNRRRHGLQFAMWPANPVFSRSWCSGCRHLSLLVTQMSWLLLLQEWSVRCLNPHGFKTWPRNFSPLYSSHYIQPVYFSLETSGGVEKYFVRRPESIKIENKSTRNIVITIRHDGLSVFPGG